MNRDMLMACEMDYSSTGEALAYGFRKAGWSVAAHNMNGYFPAASSLPMRAMFRAVTGLMIRNYNAAIVTQFDRIRPSVFMTVKGNYIQHTTLQYIRDNGALTINYYPDVHFSHNGYDQGALKSYDLFASTKSFHKEYFGDIGYQGKFIHIPHGYSDLVHYPRAQAALNQSTDVLYVGNHSAYKEEWLNVVAQELGGLNFSIIGHRWRDAVKGTPLARHVYGTAQVGDYYSRAIQEAKINIALHTGPSGPQGWEDFISKRSFEIPANRSFMLHIDNPEIRTLYEPDKEIAVFNSPKALCEKIELYLAEPALRSAIAARGYERAVPAYGHFARAQAISDEIDALRQAGKPSPIDASNRFGA